MRPEVQFAVSARAENAVKYLLISCDSSGIVNPDHCPSADCGIFGSYFFVKGARQQFAVLMQRDGIKDVPLAFNPINSKVLSREELAQGAGGIEGGLYTVHPSATQAWIPSEESVISKNDRE